MKNLYRLLKNKKVLKKTQKGALGAPIEVRGNHPIK